MAKIVDPDDLVVATDIVFRTSPNTIELTSTGAIDVNDGVTLQCVYSKVIDAWGADESLRELPLPFEAIGTGGQFDLIDGWNWYNAATIALLRDGGFSVRASSGANPSEEWACIVSLGDFEVPASQVAYFQQIDGGATVAANRPGPVNQCVQILSDPNADGSFGDGYDRRGHFVARLRAQGHEFDEYDLLLQQSIAQLTYEVYKLPLANRADTKITTVDTGIASGGSGAPDTAPFNDMQITYIAGSGFAAWIDATVYVAGSVVSSGGRWWKTALGGTSSGTGTADDVGVTDWLAYEGERDIGGTYYAFSTIINANVDDTGTDPDAVRIYEFAQYMLRQTIDIDAGAGTVTGNTAAPLLRYVGDTLRTVGGTYIDGFNAADINSIVFEDVSLADRVFPFTAVVTFEPGAQLQADPAAWFHCYFQNDDAGDDAGADWGEPGAITVQDENGAAIKGLISGRSSIPTGYAFDTNVQRGAGSAGVDVPIVVIAAGKGGAAYTKAVAVIRRNTTNVASLVAGQDRAYANP